MTKDIIQSNGLQIYSTTLGLTGEQMWDRLKDKIKPGDIILSHNGTKNTANSLDMLIKNIKSKGLEIVTISDLIYKDNYEIDNNGTQIKK